MMKNRAYHPDLVRLESREQPGSVLTQGLDLSVLASSLLSNSLLAPAVPDSSVLAARTTSQADSARTSASLVDPIAVSTPLAQPLQPVLESAATQVGVRITTGNSATAAGTIGTPIVGLNGNRPLIPDDTLWYSGDFDGVNGLANENNSVVSDARVYDNFTISDPNGWDLDTVFSHDLLSYFPTGGANYEIRTDVTAGDGGTLVALATGQNANLSLTGNDAFGFLEVEVSVPVTIHLDPGTYWLNVTPVGHGTGRSFNSTTSGANGIGSPINGLSYFDSPAFSANFAPAAGVLGQATADFSMGVGGTVTDSGGVVHHGHTTTN